jgi:hypothetical protein
MSHFNSLHPLNLAQEKHLPNHQECSLIHGTKLSFCRALNVASFCLVPSRSQPDRLLLPLDLSAFASYLSEFSKALGIHPRLIALLLHCTRLLQLKLYFPSEPVIIEVGEVNRPNLQLRPVLLVSEALNTGRPQQLNYKQATDIPSMPLLVIHCAIAQLKAAIASEVVA